MKKFLWIVVSAAVLVGVLTIPAARAAEVSLVSTIMRIYPLASGSFVLVFDAESPSCTNGGIPKYHYVTVNQNSVTDQGAKNIYAAALLALASDKQVTVVFSDSTSSCYINRLYVIR